MIEYSVSRKQIMMKLAWVNIFTSCETWSWWAFRHYELIYCVKLIFYQFLVLGRHLPFLIRGALVPKIRNSLFENFCPNQ